MGTSTATAATAIPVGIGAVPVGVMATVGHLHGIFWRSNYDHTELRAAFDRVVDAIETLGYQVPAVSVKVYSTVEPQQIDLAIGAAIAKAMHLVPDETWDSAAPPVGYAVGTIKADGEFIPGPGAWLTAGEYPVLVCHGRDAAQVRNAGSFPAAIASLQDMIADARRSWKPSMWIARDETQAASAIYTAGVDAELSACALTLAERARIRAAAGLLQLPDAAVAHVHVDQTTTHEAMIRSQHDRRAPGLLGVAHGGVMIVHDPLRWEGDPRVIEAIHQTYLDGWYSLPIDDGQERRIPARFRLVVDHSKTSPPYVTSRAAVPETWTWIRSHERDLVWPERNAR